MNKILIAYFSASGITKKLAEKLASVCNGDLFEIEPKEKYTDADLNWMDRNSRSSAEMRDINSRPEIKNKTDITTYTHILIGFPIWWYREPSIIDTFLEQYDFSGKTIIPFATSGGSEIGDTAQNIRLLATTAKVLNGKKFNANESEENLKIWLNQNI